jgi:branched-chain amino acid aminotransferase
MKSIVFFDGKFVPEEQAVVSVRTHALQYGTGCFEGIRAYYNEKEDALFAFRLEDHYKRLMLSGRVLCMDVPYSVADLCKITVELLQKNFSKEDIYIRPFLYKSDSLIGNFSLPKLTSSIAIYTVPMGRYVDTDAGVKVGVSSWERVHDNAIPPRAKITGAYVNTALAKSDALQAGFDEAIFLDRNGHVLEGSAENIFIIKDGIAVTPPVSDDILLGITRSTVMTLLHDDLNIQTIERSIGRTELYQADEVFICGTGAEIGPVVSVDNRNVGNGKPGEITSKLKKLYFDTVHGVNKKYSSWFTKVSSK